MGLFHSFQSRSTMPPKIQKSKAAKAKAAMSGGKGKRKKWNKGKARDKLNSQVLFDKSTYEKFQKDTPTYKLITTAVLADRLKLRGSLARKAIKEMESQGKIVRVSTHHACSIYTRAASEY